MRKPITLDDAHMAHINMLLSYSKDIPDDYGRALVKRITLLDELVKEARLVTQNLLGIVHDSNGVIGYHLNGVIATWDEFPEIEQAEAWLRKLTNNNNWRNYEKDH